MNILGKKVVLRAPELKDLELLHQWSNDPEIWSLLGGWHFPFSSTSTKNWIESVSTGIEHNRVFCIDFISEGLIGTANLINIDWKNRNAFHGMMIGRTNLRGKGYAYDALQAIMRYAFMELGLARLDGDMIASNQRSIDFYVNKGGWEIEGRKKDWFFRNGEYHDKVIVGMTAKSYHQNTALQSYWS